MKYEWKKHEKNFYTNLKTPTLITVPEQKYIMISGRGNPNGRDFEERVGVLMSLAYSVKMRHKADCNNSPEYASRFAYGDYAVFPLEGVWTLTGVPAENSPLDKNDLIYTIMVRQPDFITTDMYETAYAAVKKKKPHSLLNDIKFESVSDGVCIQTLHIGSFDAEPATFAKMDAYARENGYERLDCYHREIYLNDARKTTPDKYQTILRYRVKACEPK